VVRPQAKLILYDYCQLCDLQSLAPVKTVLAGSNGQFDFGPLKPGHYFLRIEDEKSSLSDGFGVEVTGSLNPKESEIIDVSPLNPDCTGGHKFIIKAN